MAYHNQYDETVSVGDWIGSLLLSLIPVVGLILMLVWAFGSNAKPSKRNFFRALLIFGIVLCALVVLGIFLLPGVLAGILGILQSVLPTESGFYS